jgi:hypothetical protein
METKLTDAEALQLTERAHSLLLSRLEQFGNILSTPHKKALHAIVEAFTQMGQGNLTGRWAFGLAAGMGKSTAVVCWITALLQLGFGDRLSVAVACEEVESLCSLIDDLEELGVNVNEDGPIGLLHRKQSARRRATPDYASKPVLFISHARVKAKHLQQFNNYNGGPRDLLVYDESLVATYSQAVNMSSLSEIAGGMARQCQRRSEYREEHGKLSAYLDALDEAYAKELERLKEIGSTQNVILPPQCSEEDHEEFMELVKGNQTVEDVLEMARYPVKVSNFNEKGVVSFQVSVPPELKQVIILDASDPIRDLVRFDQSIRSAAEDLPSMSEQALGVKLSDLKTYPDLTIYRMSQGGGKGKMRESFKQVHNRNRRISKEVVDVVKAIPETEAVLVIVFKAITDKCGTLDFEKTLKADLKAAGIDTERRIPVVERRGQAPVMKPRVVFTTWGKHTATNDYSYCTNEIQVGILHRGLLDLHGNVLGQRGSIHFKDHDRRQLLDLQLSEVAHCCYQGINRIACRSLVWNKAKTAKVWLIHYSSNLQTKLEPVLKDATWKKWETKYDEADRKKEPGIILTAAKEIVRFLIQCAERKVYQVSCRSIRQVQGCGRLKPDTFTAAVSKAVEINPTWMRGGKSLLYAPALFKQVS